jgi:hypothetical protein
MVNLCRHSSARGLWSLACIEQRSRFGSDVECRPVYRMGIGHLLFALVQFSHVMVLGNVALPITRPIRATEAGLPSGYTTITCNLVTSIASHRCLNSSPFPHVNQTTDIGPAGFIE